MQQIKDSFDYIEYIYFGSVSRARATNLTDNTF